MLPTHSPEEGNRSSLRNIVFLRIADDGQSPKPNTHTLPILCKIVFIGHERVSSLFYFYSHYFHSVLILYEVELLLIVECEIRL
jgi:hypothetical protein